MVKRAGVVVACGVLWCAGSFAGPITPPPGPVGSTPGPEPRVAINLTNTPGDADSVYRITSPGSYYLTGNMVGVNAKRGIEIAASNVTIDLRGFEMRGVAGSLSGIMVDGTRSGIAVKDGTVTAWGGTGVQLIAESSGDGEQHLVERVNAVGNGEDGIAVGDGSVVKSCLVRDNLGSHGIRARGTAVIESCVSMDNAGYAIDVGDGSTVVGCSALGNSATGITVGDGSVVASSSSRQNNAGIYAGAGSTITDCSASENENVGVRVESGATISGCTSSSNGSSGFLISNTSTIVDCTALRNVGSGIVGTLACVIRNNLCAENGSGTGDAAGILVTSMDNRIEGNMCRVNDRGIDVDGAGNFIAGNVCSGNTLNWSVVSGNVCYVVEAATSASVSGNSGGVSPGSTNAWANFTY